MLTASLNQSNESNKDKNNEKTKLGSALDALAVWRSGGWLGTDVEELDTKLLNASTAVVAIHRDVLH